MHHFASLKDDLIPYTKVHWVISEFHSHILVGDTSETIGVKNVHCHGTDLIRTIPTSSHLHPLQGWRWQWYIWALNPDLTTIISTWPDLNNTTELLKTIYIFSLNAIPCNIRPSRQATHGLKTIKHFKRVAHFTHRPDTARPRSSLAARKMILLRDYLMFSDIYRPIGLLIVAILFRDLHTMFFSR